MTLVGLVGAGPRMYSARGLEESDFLERSNSGAMTARDQAAYIKIRTMALLKQFGPAGNAGAIFKTREEPLGPLLNGFNGSLARAKSCDCICMHACMHGRRVGRTDEHASRTGGNVMRTDARRVGQTNV